MIFSSQCLCMSKIRRSSFSDGKSKKNEANFSTKMMTLGMSLITAYILVPDPSKMMTRIEIIRTKRSTLNLDTTSFSMLNSVDVNINSDYVILLFDFAKSDSECVVVYSGNVIITF